MMSDVFCRTCRFLRYKYKEYPMVGMMRVPVCLQHRYVVKEKTAFRYSEFLRYGDPNEINKNNDCKIYQKQTWLRFSSRIILLFSWALIIIFIIIGITIKLK